MRRCRRSGFDLDDQRGGARHLAGERLRAAHAAAARGEDRASGERAAEALGGAGEALVGALHDALAADVLPGGGGHARGDGEAGALELEHRLLVGPAADHHAVGHDHARARACVRKRAIGLPDCTTSVSSSPGPSAPRRCGRRTPNRAPRARPTCTPRDPRDARRSRGCSPAAVGWSPASSPGSAVRCPRAATTRARASTFSATTPTNCSA